MLEVVPFNGKADMAAKLRIRYGDLEIECEGEPSFIKGEVPQIVEAITKLLHAAPNAPAGVKGASGAGAGKSASTGKLTTTTKAIALAKGYKEGPDLVKAALACLHAVHGKECATQAEIIAEMKTVSTLYKLSMQNNMGRTVRTLMTKGDVNEPEIGKYVLSDKAKADVLDGITK